LFTVENSREDASMKFLRFKDLKQRNVVRNWTTLMRLMREQDFPAGTRVGAQARAWDEAEVEAWLESRRIVSPAGPPRPRSLGMSNTLEDEPPP
jgi:predicted DNA-binding transcriptional regulator AlpA